MHRAWLVVTAFTGIFALVAGILYVIPHSSENNTTSPTSSNAARQISTPAGDNFVEGNHTEPLPEPGTDYVSFTPAPGALLAAPWVGAEDPTGGAARDYPTLLSAEVSGNDVGLMTDFTAADVKTDWQATVRLEGAEQIDVGAGFILPPGHAEFPAGVAGKISAVRKTEDGETELTLRQAPLTELFSHLDVSFRSVDPLAQVLTDEPTSTPEATANSRTSNRTEQTVLMGATPATTPLHTTSALHNGQASPTLSTQGAPLPAFRTSDFACGIDDSSPLIDSEINTEGTISAEVETLLEDWNAGIEFSDLDIAFELDLGGVFSQPKTRFEVSFHTKLTATTDAAPVIAEGLESTTYTCKLAPSVTRRMAKRIPVGSSGAMFDIAPHLELSASAELEMELSSTLKWTVGFESNFRNTRAYRTVQPVSSEMTVTGTAGVSVAAGPRAQLSYLSLVGVYMESGLEVAGEAEVTSSTEPAGSQACLSIDLNAFIELGLFVDLLVYNKDISVLNTTIGPLAKLYEQCADLSSATPSPDVTSVDSSVPGWLRGTWCMPSAVDHVGRECIDVEEMLRENPNSGFNENVPPELEDGTSRVHLCVQFNEDDSICDMAGSAFIDYFSAGKGWNCVQDGGNEFDLPVSGCAPDYTWTHDTDYPRIRIAPNHQHADSYVDTPAMYRVEDLPNVQIAEPPLTKTLHTVPGTAAYVDAYVNRAVSSEWDGKPPPYAFTTPSGLHTCQIWPEDFDGDEGLVHCVMTFNDEVVDVLADLYGDGPPATVALFGDSARFTFIGDVAYSVTDPAPTLPYGEKLTIYGSSCGVTEEGITCSNGEASMHLNAAHYDFRSVK